jgi:hypothetical protein
VIALPGLHVPTILLKYLDPPPFWIVQETDGLRRKMEVTYKHFEVFAMGDMLIKGEGVG